MTDTPISPARRWAITLSVMMVTVMQVLDTSVTNVALPHMQGSMSAGIEEMSWVVTSYLAANAVAIPATGWLSARFGRRRFFLICTVLFTLSSFLSGVAPNLEFLVAMRVFQGLGGGPVIPMAQAIMWEIFPLRQRGTAMAVWGIGINVNTLPLELQGLTTTVTTPEIYALGTLTTGVSAALILLVLGVSAAWRARRSGAGG